MLGSYNAKFTFVNATLAENILATDFFQNLGKQYLTEKKPTGLASFFFLRPLSHSELLPECTLSKLQIEKTTAI